MIVNEYQMKLDDNHRVFLYIKQKYKIRKMSFETIDDINEFINKLYDLTNVIEEYSYVVAFDLNMNLLGVFQLSHGNDEKCVMDAKVIFRFLLLIGASQFVLYHNHSSNILQMSTNDELLTREIYQVSEYLNIKMLDHIIICKDGTVSCLNEIKIKNITIDDVM